MPGRQLLAGLLLLAAALAATRLGLEPPAPLPATAPAAEFSAGRALDRLRRILDAAGPGVPHPAGSAAGVRVREAVVAELRALGLEPRVDAGAGCSRYLACTPVANVIARIRGRNPGPAVLVSAHHDSVPAGPGAADDGSGVAVALELAHVLSADPPPSDVLLLLDDAEESGLGGAVAFLSSPEAREVGAVVNLEARGTAGASLLFETSGSSARVARALAGASRPVSSSLFAAVYRLIPNDTNLTVLQALGVPGANLAFVEGAVRYHTPRDDLAHLDPRTVQHQGENALALVRGLAGPGRDEGQAVWFDLLGRILVRFPETWALPLALLGLALAAWGAVAAIRRREARASGLVAGAFAVPLGVAVAAILGHGEGRALGLDPIFRPWVANPGPLVASFFLAGLAGAALPALLLGRIAGAAGMRAGGRLVVALGAVALATWMPGASHLLLAPVLAGGLVLAVEGRAPSGAAASDLAALAAGALVLLPPAWLLYPALGHGAGPLAAACLAVAALPLAAPASALPWRTRALLVALPAIAAAASLGVAVLVPGADADAPERIVVYFHQDADSGRARVLASPDTGRLPPELRAAAPFSDAPAVPFGWGTLRPSFSAAAAPLEAPGPELELSSAVRSGDALRWRGRLRSPRGADEIQLAVPPAVKVVSVAVDGVAVPAPVPKLARWFGGWWVYRLHAGPAGVEVAMETAGAGPLELVLADRSPDLPPAAARVAAARPPWAVTVQEGDGTLFTRRVRIEAEGPAVR